MADAPKTLAAKLAEIMNEVESVPKRGRNDFHKYDYATEADIAGAIRGGLARRSIMLLPSVTAWKDETRTSGERNDKSKTITTVDMVFSFIDGDTKERLDLPWVGRGEDSSDKGIYKALTGALKFFLMKAFLIPTGDDPEHDSKSDRQERKQRRPVTMPSGAKVDPETGEEIASTPRTIDGDQHKVLIATAKDAGWTKDELQRFVKDNYGAWSKMPASDFDTVRVKLSSGVETGVVHASA
jgi:hypothetical protein